MARTVRFITVRSFDGLESVVTYLLGADSATVAAIIGITPPPKGVLIEAK